jgi:membrane-associated protease RseP (regulator of RpoE activity)
MRSNFGWQALLTRTLAVGAVLAWTTAMTQAQLSNPTPNRPEPRPSGQTSPTTADPAQHTAGQPATDPNAVNRDATNRDAANGTGTNRDAANGAATNQVEATGTGHVLGAHFEHGARGAQQELKITTVDANSPAGQAGLQPNDRLVSIDGRSFANHRQLIAYLSSLDGRPVPVVFERNGRQMQIQLFPGRFQGDHAWLGVQLEDEQAAQTFANQNGPGQPGQNGQGQPAQNPQSQNGQNAQVSGQSSNTPGANKNAAADDKGAEISDVYPNGPAARAGLRPGDVITEVNGQKIEDAADLVALIHEMKPQAQAQFEVLRDNKSTKMPVTLGSRNQEYAAQFGPNQNGPQYGPQGPAPYGAQPYGAQQYGPQQFQGYPQQGPWQGQGQAQGQVGYGQNDIAQQVTQQNQKIEEELKQLREEIRQLREAIQKK